MLHQKVRIGIKNMELMDGTTENRLNQYVNSVRKNSKLKSVINGFVPISVKALQEEILEMI